LRLHLVRHARALSRSGHEGPDRERALSSRGHRQAELLADLGLFDRVVRVISSPAVRCIDTVAPVAARLDLQVKIDERLFEGNPGTAVFDIAAAADEAGELILCSHGDLIPDALHLVQLRGALLDGPGMVAKGSTWSLHFDGERVTTATYTDAPE